MVRYKSQINYNFFFQLHIFLSIILNILILYCFVFTRSTNMATKLTLKIIILDLIKWLSSRFYVFRNVVTIYLIVCVGNFQDKSRSSVISLIKFGTKRQNFAFLKKVCLLFIIAYFKLISFCFLALISKVLLFILTYYLIYSQTSTIRNQHIFLKSNDYNVDHLMFSCMYKINPCYKFCILIPKSI